MANKSKVQSVEPDIADLVNGWLKSYGLDYKLEQASLNSEIDKALDEYQSDYSKEIMLFLTCSMGKSIENKFSYGKKLRSSQSFKFKMQLPVKNEQPDYELMSTLISAIQKLVIADVVKFSDEKIKATKQVVG